MLRLRMKVWTHPATGDLYLTASARFDGPDRLIVYAMRDEDTIQLALTVDEWNALPFRYFAEDGEAPRPEKAWNPDRGGPMRDPRRGSA